MATISFAGLTGIDFGTIVDSLMQIERQPITLLEQRKTQLEGRNALYSEIKSALARVQTAAKALASPAKLTFSAATSSHTDRLAVSADSSAAVGSYAITVERLATSTRVTSGFATQLGMSANVDLDQNLNLAASHLGRSFTGGYVTINGTQVAVNINTDDPADPDTNDTIQELIDRINATVAGVSASYDVATDRLKLTSSQAITIGSPDDTSNFLELTGLLNSPDTVEGSDHVRTATHRLGRINTSAALGSNTFGTALASSGSFVVNGVTIDYDAGTDSLNQVISRINTLVPTVVASYDSQTDKLILSSKQTGSLGITLSDTTGNFLAAAGLLSAGESQAVVSSGQNAKITVDGFNNGQPIYSTSNTVTGVIPGLTLTLKQADASQTVTVNVTRDGSELKSRLREFVTQYNAALELISTRLTEEPIKNPASTTLARVGLLRGDSLLAGIKMRLTEALTGAVTGLPSGFNRMGNLGVSIDKANYNSGRLAFDETAFDAAIKDNFEQAYDILFADADGDGVIDDGEGGVMPRLLAQLSRIIDDSTQEYGGRAVPLGDIARRIWSLSDQSKTIDARIDSLEDRLTVREKALRAKFLAAEQAISQLQGSQSSLTAYASSLTIGRA